MNKEQLFDTLKALCIASLQKNDEYTVAQLYEDIARNNNLHESECV